MLAYSIEQQGSARRLRRVAVGADLRLAGPVSGYSIGVNVSELITPQHSVMPTPDALANDVAQFLADGDASEEPEQTYGIFYLSYPGGDQTTIARITQLGIGVIVEPQGGSAVLGFSSMSRYVGPALADGVVHLETRHADNDTNWNARLWSLENPSAPDEPFHQRSDS